MVNRGSVCMKLRDIKEGTNGKILSGSTLDLEREVGDITTDSRLVKKGDVFIAIKGERVDGHDYIQDAVSRGAQALVLSRTPSIQIPESVLALEVDDTVLALGRLAAYWRNKMPAKTIGITGSVGKTSTKEVTASILSRKFVTLRSQKSYNNEIGLPLTLLGLTPEVEVAVLEMGGAYRMGEIEYLCSIAKPFIGVVIVVGYAHIGRMGSLERIAENKSELVRSLSSEGFAILNRDDHRVKAMADVTKAHVVWYGLDEESYIRATDVVSEGLNGIRFVLHIGDRSYQVKAPLLGRHSVHTILASVAVAHVMGMEDQEIVHAIKELPPGLRLIVNKGINGSIIIDDTYNANPTSMLAALNLLNDIEGHRIAVLGDMAELGHFTEEGHLKVGARAAEVCDKLYTVGELAQIIARGALQAGMNPGDVVTLKDYQEAIDVLKRDLNEGDVVLVKASRIVSLDKVVAALTVQNEVVQ